MKIELVEATTINDAWFQCLYHLFAFGRRYKIDRGSYEGQERIEYDYITVHIKYPGTRPLLPDIPPNLGVPRPADEKFLDKYLFYLMSSEKQENEQYTYGEFIEPQLGYVIDMLKHTPNTNQACINIGDIQSIKLEHPPCLRVLDFRVKDGKLNMVAYFRSWDLWNGFPVNLAGLQMLKEIIAEEVGLKDGEIIASSKGLHCYSYVEDFVKQRTGSSGNPSGLQMMEERLTDDYVDYYDVYFEDYGEEAKNSEEKGVVRNLKKKTPRKKKRTTFNALTAF